MPPRITIITVCWNSAATIRDALHSVQGQGHPEIEHLVIDGGSRDGTVDLVNRGLRAGGRCISEPDHGIYDAMNKGLRLARGEVIGFLNADDVLNHSGVIARVAEAMADQRTDACYADLVYVAQDDVRIVKRAWRSSPPRLAAMSVGWIPPHPTFYARRSVYERYGLFDLRCRLAADHEILTRFIARHRIRCAYIPEVWVRMRVGGATNRSLRNITEQNLEIVRTLHRHRLGPSPLLPLIKLMDRWRQRRVARVWAGR